MAHMSIPKITGREARELLDVCPPWDRVKIAQTVDLDHGPDRAVLAGSAHDLAETVAWLYGKPITADRDGDFYEAPHGGYTYAEDAKVDVNISQGPFTPDEAVDLARALLAAAEEARP